MGVTSSQMQILAYFPLICLKMPSNLFFQIRDTTFRIQIRYKKRKINFEGFHYCDWWAMRLIEKIFFSTKSKEVETEDYRENIK